MLGGAKPESPLTVTAPGRGETAQGLPGSPAVSACFVCLVFFFLEQCEAAMGADRGAAPESAQRQLLPVSKGLQEGVLQAHPSLTLSCESPQ